MKKLTQTLFIVTVTLFISGCSNTIKNVANSTMDTFNNLTKKAPPKDLNQATYPIHFNKNIRFYSRTTVNKIIKTHVTPDEKGFLYSLELLHAVTKENNNYTINTFEQTLQKLNFDSIAHMENGNIAVTKELKKLRNNRQTYFVTYLLIYNKNGELYQVVNFAGGGYGKLFLSKDGKFALSQQSLIVIDLKSFNTIKKFTTKEFYNSKYTTAIDNIEFVNNNQHLYYSSSYFNNMSNQYSKNFYVQDLTTNKIDYYEYLWNATNSIGINKLSPDGKYIAGNQDQNGINRHGFTINETASGVNKKVFFENDFGPTRLYIQWSKDHQLFYNYYRNRNEVSGIYDTNTDKTYCKDLKGFNNIQEILWTDDDHIYIFDKENITPIVFQDNNCIQMSSYKHDIKYLGNKHYKKTLLNTDSEATFYFTTTKGTQTFKSELKKFTPQDINIKLSIQKAIQLLDNGFEKRGLELLEKLAKENYEWNGMMDVKTKKQQFVYAAYLATQHFNKRMQRSKEIDIDLLRDYRTFVSMATWHGFEQLIPEATKRFKEAVQTKELFNEKEIKDAIVVAKVIYLLSINKDDEAYDLLFNAQPLAELAKNKFLKPSTLCSKVLQKNIKKLAVASNIPEKKLSKISCIEENSQPYFFDIDGNKVFRDALKNQLIPTQKSESKPKKTEKIELLD